MTTVTHFDAGTGGVTGGGPKSMDTGGGGGESGSVGRSIGRSTDRSVGRWVGRWIGRSGWMGVRCRCGVGVEGSCGQNQPANPTAAPTRPPTAHCHLPRSEAPRSILRPRAGAASVPDSVRETHSAGQRPCKPKAVSRRGWLKAAARDDTACFVQLSIGHTGPAVRIAGKQRQAGPSELEVLLPLGRSRPAVL